MIQILTGIQNTSAALDAERTRLDVISQNIANAHTTHDVDGKPYQRKVVVFETALENDQRPPIKVYDPGNPEADARGMVAMPNINIHEEMADLISASRTFEANLAVVKNARSMALATLAIGKH